MKTKVFILGLILWSSTSWGVVCVPENTWDFDVDQVDNVGWLWDSTQPITVDSVVFGLETGDADPTGDPNLMLVSTTVYGNDIVMNVNAAGGCAGGVPCRENRLYGITGTLTDADGQTITAYACIQIGPPIATPTPTATGPMHCATVTPTSAPAYHCATYTPIPTVTSTPTGSPPPTWTPWPTATPTPRYCCGDCNGDNVVSDDEVDSCAYQDENNMVYNCPFGRGCDCNGDGVISRAERIFITEWNQLPICPNYPAKHTNKPLEFD